MYYNAYGTQDYFNDTDYVETVKMGGYCDQLYDSETGNYYMRARYYNPETGRFITEDPIKDGVNWYSYCGGNPVMFWDILGLRKVIAVIGEDEDSNNNVFISNVETFKHDNPNDEIYTINSWDYESEKELMKAISNLSKELKGIDALVFESHGTTTGNAYMANGYFLDGNSKWDKIKFNDNANIRFSGCRIGGDHGKKDKNSLAQKVANITGCTVYAFLNKTSQVAYDINGNKTTDINNIYSTYQEPVRYEYNENLYPKCAQFKQEENNLNWIWRTSNFGMFG